MKFPILLLATSLSILGGNLPSARADDAQYPVQRPVRSQAPAASGEYAVHPDQPRQVIDGLGFEIQSDSIGSANQGLPEAFAGVPHDLVPTERQRFAREMLTGFRYCRLAGGLYWRGTDPEGKRMQGRWPEQMAELKEMLDSSGVDGVSLEYWSPAPFWKACGTYVGPKKETNLLKCYGPDFAADPVYHGDTGRFFKDFSAALVDDIRYLQKNGIKVKFWGLQNEPRAGNAGNDYSRCGYTMDQYVRAFSAVAPAIRAQDPSIRIIADSWALNYVEPIKKNPETWKLVDALVLHHVGSDAKVIPATVARARARFGTEKPLYQNEYEYLWGPTSPARCMNTVLHVMNWFQIGEAPAWYWIHALKPITNAEASGYSLGFWRPSSDTNPGFPPKFPGLKPGHWQWNKYNWHAVAGFIKHMPWNSRGVAITEANQDMDLRIFAFKKPNGKLTVVLANRGGAKHTFKVDTGITGASFNGFRYSPDEAGVGFLGKPIGSLSGGVIMPELADMTWEFWEQQ